VTVVEERDGFVGVVAADPRTAARALAAIHDTWDLPEAPSEAGLDDWLRSHPAAAEGWAGAVEHAVGDAEAALERSTVRLAAAYRIAYVAHVPAETRSAVAEWSDGRVTVWTGTQRPFGVRAELAGALGLDEAAVRVIVGPTGTGFGGKQDATIALEAARLARAAGAPVRVKWSREVEYTSGYLRPAALIDVQSGADDEGRLAAWSMTTYNAGPNAILPPYDVPNQAIRFQPTVSPLPQGAYRGLAATANTFARESHLDELARRLGVDPLEFRLAQLTDDRLAAVLSAAAARAGWSDAGRAEGRDDGYGVGIACGMEKGGRVATVAEVKATPGEPLEIARIVTAFECGAIVNPSGLAAQIEGATVMALGPTLFEAIHFEAGRITNPRLSAYPVPRFTTVPPIEVVLVDRPDLPSAGAGETPLIGVAPAVANAIADACGVRLRSLPLVPTGTLARG
jgi:isoquinoline 1-oxidoreductase